MTDNNSIRLPFIKKDILRVFAKIKLSTEHFYKGEPCWDFQGKTQRGYGKCYYNKRAFPIHSFTYQLFTTLIPAGLECDHLCKRPVCCNPSHIEAVTHWENVMRSNAVSAINARKTHCSRGHPLQGEAVVQTKNGRVCITCRNQWATERYRRLSSEELMKSRQQTRQRFDRSRKRLLNLPDDDPRKMAYREKNRLAQIKIRKQEKIRFATLPYDHPDKVHRRERNRRKLERKKLRQAQSHVMS